LNNVRSEKIVQVIQKDPGMTSKILRLASSARFGRRDPVTSVAEATVVLGTDEVASMAMTSGCASFFMGYGDSTPRSNKSLWDECLHVAFFARHLAARAGLPDPELAYTVGLLQNIGHIVLDRFLDEDRDAILDRVDEGDDLLAAERAVLGVDHTQCGARMAIKWSFPETLVRGIRFHHKPSQARDLAGLCAVVSLAESLAYGSLQNPGTSLLYPTEPRLAAALQIDDEALEELTTKVRSELIDTSRAVA